MATWKSTKCRICPLEELEEINECLARDTPYRWLAKEYKRYNLNSNHFSWHNQDCLGRAKKIPTPIGTRDAAEFQFKRELRRRYKQSTKMLDALEKWLVDPENSNEFFVGPRSTEIIVAYEDFEDINYHGNPRKKKAKLSLLLQLATGNTKRILELQSLATDNRKLFVDAFKPLIELLKEIAKTEGFYKEKQENAMNEETERLRLAIAAQARENGVSYEEELRYFMSLPVFETVVPEVRTQLTSELVQ